ncbi:MAG: hypothetical protein HYY06_15055 [Deltaproteobacteria bacterium]|nr:hypothetical protein [Deltaproteobacteria bacterium]
MLSRLRLAFLVSILAACVGPVEPDDLSGGGGGKADGEGGETVRIVEVLASPAAFIELRNDSEAERSLDGFSIGIGSGKRRALAPRQVPGSAEAVREIDPAIVPAHGLALVVDSDLTDAQIERMACESPIAQSAVERPGMKATLAATLRLQLARHCLPVFEVKDLGDKLQSATAITLAEGTTIRDSASGSWASGAPGVAFERTGFQPGELRPSPIGSTPGARNYFGSDPLEMANPAGRRPIEVLSSSPWRVGDMLTKLRREGDAAHLAEIEDGKLPANPLVSEFDALVSEGRRRVAGSFYQVNEPDVIAALVDAKAAGAEVGLTTDAEFRQHEDYVAGFAALEQGGVDVVFDADASGANRAPLSHDKFLALDGTWLWTGSFNPIEDEPARIHADNVLVLRSPALAALHEQEFETMFSGQFGVLKRDEGIGGGEAFVDGAPIDVRFSPGLTPDQLGRRVADLDAGGDGCGARVASTGAYVIEDRYRSLDPCGGPFDFIVGEVARARSSVYMVAFSFALEELADVMLERMGGAGVEVRGVVDPTVVGRGAPSRLLEAGADIRYTPNSDPECPAWITPRRLCPKNPNKVWLHHKFILIDYGTDHPVVITGSHNLSLSAEKQNDEALVVIRDRAVAEVYYRIFRETFDHPQTLGERRQMADLPALAITEVRGSAAPAATQFVEIANLGDAPASLEGLELWNRSTVRPLRGELAAGARAVVVVGSAAELPIPAGPIVIEVEADALAPFVGLGTALVLRRSGDRRWISTYDPYTAAANVPPGVAAPAPGAAVEWIGFDSAALAALTVELLGVDTTPDAERPTWSPRGFFSDWLDEHDVTPAGLVLMRSVLDPWMPSSRPEGTPGS